MATRQQFCDEMERVYNGHGVYIGGANGEKTESLTIGKIRQLEENYPNRNHASDIKRDLTYIGNCYGKGWSMKDSYSGDCSGEVVGAQRRLKIISESADYNCRSYMAVCKTVGLNDLQPSDLVFNKATEPSHMGVCVAIENGKPIIVESKGRDDGVVRRPVNEGGWVVGGRLPDSWFDDDIMVLTRILKYIPDNMMRGEDVRQVQIQLQLAGYTPGTADGVFGKKTKIAVQAFQLDNNLEADGIVGKNTATALGFKWEG